MGFIKDIAYTFSPMLIRAFLMDEHDQWNAVRCKDYFKNLAEFVASDDMDESMTNICFLINKVSRGLYGNRFITENDATIFKKLWFIAGMMERIADGNPVSEDEWDQVQDILHEIKVIVMG